MKVAGSAGAGRTSAGRSAPGGTDDELRRRLRQLAAGGLGCLVVGHVPTGRYREETRKLFGAPGNPRLRTMTLTGEPTAADEWFPGDRGAADPAHEVVTLPNAARGGSAAAAPDASGPCPRIAGETLDRDAVETAILDAIRSVERRRPGVDAPLTLRFGLHRWDVFEHDVPDAHAVLETVLEAVHERGGLSHVHYPRHVDGGRDPFDDPVVSRLYHAVEEFDVVVELRVDGETGATHQRWGVPDRRLTGWSTL